MRSVEPIVLVMCPAWGINMPPLGISYLAAYLRAEGWQVSSMDLNVGAYHQVPPELRHFWRPEYIDLWMRANFMELIGGKLLPLIDWSVQQILAQNPRVVGFSVNQANLYFSVMVAERLRALLPHLFIVFGGPGVYFVDKKKSIPVSFRDFKGETILRTIDVLVHGDGEETFTAVLRARERGDDLRSVNAISFWADDALHTTGPHRPNRSFDHFPFPDLDWVDYDGYREIELDADTPVRIAPILLSRGCTNTCKFCNDFVMQGKFRSRSGHRTVEEMKLRLERQKLDRFYFCDLLVNGDMEQLGQMAQAVVDARLLDTYPFMSWTGQALASGRMTPEYLDLLWRSGCRALSYGVESLSDKVLKAMRKGITVAEIEGVLKASKAAGLFNQINLIVGYPGEGEPEFRETIENLKRLRPWIDRVSALSMLTLTYGSPLFIALTSRKDFREFDEFHRLWTEPSDPGNTFEVRSERFEQLHLLLSELGLMTLWPQFYEKARSSAKVELGQTALL